MLQTNFLVKASITEAQIAALAKKYMLEFFPQYKHLPAPRFKIMATKSRRLGVCKYKAGEHTTTIAIQRTIADIPESLDRVLLHELIHHIDFLVNGKEDPKKVTHHGFFLEMAQKVNAKRGKDFVTPESDSISEKDLDEDIYALIWPWKTGQLAFQSSKKLNDAQKNYIANTLSTKKGKIIKTRDSKLQRDVVAIGSKSVSVPQYDSELVEILKELYKNSDPKLQKEFSKFDEAGPYYILIWPTGVGNKLGYASSLKITPKEKETVDRLTKEHKARLVQTKDPRWLTGPKLRERGRMAVPKSDEEQETLRKMYNG